MSNTGPEGPVPSGAPGGGGARLRRAQSAAGQGSGHIPPHHDPSCWGCGDNPNGLHLPQPTEIGAAEYEALLQDVLPFLGALARSLDGIFGEVYGEG